jgi:hypothetical protein
LIGPSQTEQAPARRNTANGAELNWRRLLVFSAAALIVFLLSIALADRDLSFILSIPFAIFIGPVVLFRALGWKMRLTRWRLLALVVYWVTVVGVVTNYSATRDAARWMVRSHWAKSEILAQPLPANGEFKHIEWDGWGFPGAGDTTVYLVFDPANSLAAAAKGGKSGKYLGLPCEVYRVRRLQSGWYSVQFYTDEFWGRSGSLNCGPNN